MTLSTAITIKNRSIVGEFGWNCAKQTYQAKLDFFDIGSFRPSITYGLHFAEFITPDSLVNYLALRDIHISDESLKKIFDFRNSLEGRMGSSEIVGLNTAEKFSLYIITPDAQRIALSPAINHPDYYFQWGDSSTRTVETAKSIYRVLWSGSDDINADSFSLSFVYEFLANTKKSFSLRTSSICDWYLTDLPLRSSKVEI